MEELLGSRTALVTGGARGIGRAIVGQFAKHGARGVVLDIESAVNEADLPNGFSSHVGDVNNESEIAAAFAELAANEGRIDIVVANAGIVPPWRETTDLDFEEWERVFAINVRGVAATVKHAARAMKEHGGSIVITASVNALEPHGRQLAYTASKHAVVGIMRCAALDLGRFNIRVNAIAPGPVLTEALRERIRYRHRRGGPSEEESEKALAADTPLNRTATEEEVGKVALFLASHLASAVTGRLLPVDSGLS